LTTIAPPFVVVKRKFEFLFAVQRTGKYVQNRWQPIILFVN